MFAITNGRVRQLLGNVATVVFVQNISTTKAFVKIGWPKRSEQSVFLHQLAELFCRQRKDSSFETFLAVAEAEQYTDALVLPQYKLHPTT